MERGFGRGRGGTNQGSPYKAAPRGQFIDGIWHCDCDPRMPAEHFETKNGGKNHGRWFYTCQKPQPKRCKFFLWEDDAKKREKATVLNNSRSEPVTPRKRTTAEYEATPSRQVAHTSSKQSGQMSSDSTFDHEDSFEWGLSDEDVFANVESAWNTNISRKVAKTTQFSSSSKRTRTEAETDDVFQTPSTSTRGKSGLLSPEETPAADRIKDAGVKKSDLVSEVLETLSSVSLSPDVRNTLIEVLSRNELRFQGIAKGRDISRLAIQSKDKRIAELESRIAGLEAERDTSKLVIAHLKHDISTPKKKTT